MRLGTLGIKNLKVSVPNLASAAGANKSQEHVKPVRRVKINVVKAPIH